MCNNFQRYASGNRIVDTADRKSFKYFVHLSCTFRFFLQMSISDIHRVSEKLFRIAYARGRQMTPFFFMHILQTLLAPDVERLTQLIAVIRVYCYMPPHGSCAEGLIIIIVTSFSGF
jgi:hypothetical protein